jgi:multiple sugar transport system ATP-binding protein
MTMASRIGVLEQGRLVQLGSPREIYEDPVNIHVATRLGSPSVNLVPRGLFPSLKAPRETATIGVRTEHVRISKNTTWDRAVGPKERTEGPKERTKGRNGSAVGRIRWIEHLGSQSHLHVTIADTEMITLADPHSGLAVGDEVEIEMMAPLFFDTRGDRVRWPEEAP